MGPSIYLLYMYLFSYAFFILKTKVEKADDVKARVLLEKLAEDESKMKAQKDMAALCKKQEQCLKDYRKTMEAIKVHMASLIPITYSHTLI